MIGVAFGVAFVVAWGAVAHADPAPAHPLLEEVRDFFATLPETRAAAARTSFEGTLDVDPTLLGNAVYGPAMHELMPLVLEHGADRSLRQAARRLRRGDEQEDTLVIHELEQHDDQAGLWPEDCEDTERWERDPRCAAGRAVGMALPDIAAVHGGSPFSKLRAIRPLFEHARAAGVPAGRLGAIGARLLAALARVERPRPPARDEHPDLHVLRALLRAVLPEQAAQLDAIDTTGTSGADANAIRDRAIASTCRRVVVPARAHLATIQGEPTEFDRYAHHPGLGEVAGSQSQRITAMFAAARRDRSLVLLAETVDFVAASAGHDAAKEGVRILEDVARASR